MTEQIIPDPLSDFKKALADWVTVHRLPIWVGCNVEDELVQLLADYGVQIPTPDGMMELWDLTNE